MVENLKESSDLSKETFSTTRFLLSLLEKETRISFFNETQNWLKKLFWFKESGNNVDNIRSSKNESTENPIQKSTQNSTKKKEKLESSNSSNSNNLKKIGDKSVESKNNINSFANKCIPESKVKQARDYITNWWTFHSSSKWTVTWGWGDYKRVCSTWSFNVLWKMGIPKVSNSTPCDLKWKILPKMGFEYIWEVDPDNPEKNWYKPQNGDTAVWPRFYNGRKMTQHQATFINGHWVSDTIQNKMSCYSSKNEPMVKVYRYTWKNLA